MSYTSIFCVDNFTDTEMIWINGNLATFYFLSNLSVVKITNGQVSLANDFVCYILLLWPLLNSKQWEQTPHTLLWDSPVGLLLPLLFMVSRWVKGKWSYTPTLQCWIEQLFQIVQHMALVCEKKHTPNSTHGSEIDFLQSK